MSLHVYKVDATVPAMNLRRPLTCFGAGALLLVGLSGCDSDDPSLPGEGEETEVITTVRLTFTPQTGEPIVAEFFDPDGEGVMSGTVDTLDLTYPETYAVSVEFLNELEDPSEDITEEIAEEAEAHQILFAVTSNDDADPPYLTHTYVDVESDWTTNDEGDDLPVGLSNTIETTNFSEVDPGVSLRVMLRHMPPINDTPQKVGGIAEDFAAGRALPGEVDIDISFPVTLSCPTC